MFCWVIQLYDLILFKLFKTSLVIHQIIARITRHPLHLISRWCSALDVAHPGCFWLSPKWRGRWNNFMVLWGGIQSFSSSCLNVISAPKILELHLLRLPASNTKWHLNRTFRAAGYSVFLSSNQLPLTSLQEKASTSLWILLKLSFLRGVEAQLHYVFFVKVFIPLSTMCPFKVTDFLIQFKGITVMQSCAKL